MADDRLRALLICYFFPPLGGAGIGRSLAMVDHLSAHGIDIEVLTVKDVAYHIFEPELLEGRDQSLIHRAGSLDPTRLMFLAGQRGLGKKTGRRRSRRLFPDSRIGWVRMATKLGSRLHGERPYDVIISTSPPMSAHLVARNLSERHGIPWVADFRDPWTSYTIEDWYDDERYRDRAWELIESIRSQASAVTTTNRAIADYLGGGEAIPTGFDPARVSSWKSAPDIDDFVIGILGTIDELTPIQPLLKLLQAARQKHPDVFEKVTLCHVGREGDAGLSGQIAAHGLTDRFHSHGLCSRSTTVDLLSNAALLYLGIGSDRAAMLTPGRLFDMVASGRPLLAWAPPDSEVAQIVGQVSRSHCFSSDHNSVPDDAIDFMIKLIRSKHAGENIITTVDAAAHPLAMPSTMGRMAEVIRALLVV